MNFLTRLLLGIVLVGQGMAIAANEPDPVALFDATPAFHVEQAHMAWLEQGTATLVDEAARKTQEFQNSPALTRHAMASGATLWIRLAVARQPGNSEEWTLNIPSPFLDSVTLYQLTPQGTWTQQQAGDRIAQANWSRRGLYPDFTLQIPPTGTLELMLQIRNFKPSAIPMELVTKGGRDAKRLTEFLVLGLALGALLAMAALSTLRFGQHRDKVDGLAAVYALLVVLTLAQFNGVLNATLWSTLPEWGNYFISLLPPLTVGYSLLFVRQLYALSTRYRRYDLLLAGAGWFTIVSVLIYAVLDRGFADRIGSIILLLATTIALIASVLSLREGSTVGRWLVLAYLPQFLGAMYLFAEAMGFVPQLWQMRYITSFNIALSVPVMIYALELLTRDRKELMTRARHLPTQDALTGLLTPETFQNLLDDALLRSIREREPIALVMVNLVNHDYVRTTHGDTIAEQCLLRAVIKIQRILRDVDPAGRLGSSHFALLMEGVRDREAVNERMVKLIASGLIPLRGLTPEVALHFQAACVLLHENPVPADQVLVDLRAMLTEMSSRARRPIRFLEPVATEAAPLQSEHGPA
jgi:diguanylate cyclase (GGDEF)-like protein